MHLHIIGSVTLSQISVRGVRGSTDSLVLLKISDFNSSNSSGISFKIFGPRYSKDPNIGRFLIKGGPNF